MAWMQIDTTRASLEITTKRAQLNIQSRMPQMRIRNKMPTMSIERNDPKMSIDWDPYNAQVGMDKPLAMSRRFVEQADYKAREGISRIVREGNQLSQIKGPSHADISYTRMMERNRVTLGHNRAQARPIINWEGGGINVNWSAREFEIEWDTDTTPIITYDPYEVEIRMRNYPSLKITLTKEYYEHLERVGRLDKSI